jgi:hypothetical protein
MPVAAESPSSWDVPAAINTCPIQPWSGSVWRCHSSKYAGNDAAGSLRATGRFNRGADRLQTESVVEVVEILDPDLFVDWDNL